MPTGDSRLEASEKLLRELLVRFRHSFFCYLFQCSCYGGGSRDSWKSSGRGSWASPGQSRAVNEDRNSRSLCDSCVTMVYSGTTLVWRALQVASTPSRQPQTQWHDSLYPTRHETQTWPTLQRWTWTRPRRLSPPARARPRTTVRARRSDSRSRRCVPICPLPCLRNVYLIWIVCLVERRLPVGLGYATSFISTSGSTHRRFTRYRR